MTELIAMTISAVTRTIEYLQPLVNIYSFSSQMILSIILMIFIIGAHHFLFSLAEIHQSSSVVDCIVHTVRLIGKNKITLQFTEDNQDLATAILQQLKHPVVINTVEHRIPTELELRTSDDVLLLLKDEEPVRILNETLWNGDTRFVVVTQDEKIVERYFQDFWKLNVINVFGLVVAEGNVSIYSFLPYGKNCTKAELIIVDSCLEGKLQNEGSALKDTMRIKNMNQCPVSITVNPILPGLIFEPKEGWKNSSTVRGFEGNLMMEVAKVYNFNATYKIAEDGIGWGWILPSPRGSIGDLYRGVTDISVGMQAPLLQRYQFLDLATNFYTDECVTFAVPQGYKGKQAAWVSNFILEFTYYTWTAVFCSFIMIIINMWLINRFLEVNWFSSKTEIALFVFSICLEMPVKIPHYKSSKLSVLLWIVCTFIITVAYKASMGSLLAVPPHDADIKDFKDLLDSDLVPTGLKNQIQLMRITKEWPFPELLNRYRYSEQGVGQMVQRIANREKIASLYPKSSFYYHSLNNRKIRGRVHVINGCVYPYHPYAMLRKFSPLTRRVSQVIRRLEESGIMVMWRAEYYKKILPPKKPFFKLSMEQMLGVFCFLLSGYIIAAVAFLREVDVILVFRQRCLVYVERSRVQYLQ